ncbi:RNA 2'-phosphotransferase [Photobacterium sp. 53610]|uniref:RNA 2'-phosphotransferase n=1 Tax=Photobacterium sp. 53610 TaxID=3102789 RepID=UPI002ED98F27
MNKEITKISKYLSFILRHKPESIALVLDRNGWASIDDLIRLSQDIRLSKEILEFVVATNDKRRFVIDETGTKIRANQGHTIQVDLDLTATEPPGQLFHGTAEQNVSSIFNHGLVKGERHHVHLTESIEISETVGKRYGKPVIFKIDSERMHTDGFLFYKTYNNVWLTDIVPAEYLEQI